MFDVEVEYVFLFFSLENVERPADGLTAALKKIKFIGIRTMETIKSTTAIGSVVCIETRWNDVLLLVSY